jgi:LysM repeat protein
MAAQTNNSPIQGLKSLRGLTVVSTPATVSAVTPTHTLAAGAVIYVPPVSTATHIPQPAPCYHPAGWATYVVQSGETLYQVGLKFGATATILQNGNCMGRSLLIYTGQVLYVPNVPPTILNVVLTPDTPQPGITLIPTDVPTIEPTPTPQTPSLTPTPVDAPSYFNNPTASASSCALSFSVAASDADGIEAVKVVYSINNVKSVLAVTSQSQGVYMYSTTLTQSTTPSDFITYYFKIYDQLGHITESGKATIQADNCLP